MIVMVVMMIAGRRVVNNLNGGDYIGDAYVGEYDNGGDEDRRQVKHLVVAQVETVQGGEAGDGGRQACKVVPQNLE